MKAYRGSRFLAPLILNLDTRWKFVVTFTPPFLFPREKLRYAVNMGLRDGLNIADRRKIFDPSGNRDSDHPAPILVDPKNSEYFKSFAHLFQAMLQSPTKK